MVWVLICNLHNFSSQKIPFMKSGFLINVSFVISTIGIFLGAMRKIMHAEGADAVLTFGILGFLVFIVCAIYEVRTSTRVDHFEKTIWTLGFIFFGFITGIFYLIVRKSRVV